MNSSFVIVLLLAVLWLIPPVVMWLRGRTNWAGCAVWLPIVNLLILVKVVRQPATPNSLWAEQFYGENMMEVSRKRYPLAPSDRDEHLENQEKARTKRAKKKGRKQKRKARKETRDWKRKQKIKEHRRPSQAIADAKAKDKKAKDTDVG
jgi:hypothetical protein